MTNKTHNKAMQPSAKWLRSLQRGPAAVNLNSWAATPKPIRNGFNATFSAKLIGALVVAMVAGCQSAPVDEQADIAALRALDQAYASEWLAGDADGVMSLFTADATLVPHHGDAPVVGHAAIRDFWFNPKYPPTVIPAWTRDAKEIVVSGDVGIVRGRARLTWEYDGVRTTIPEGNYVLVAVRRFDGWRIRMLTWNDDPRNWLREPIIQN